MVKVPVFNYFKQICYFEFHVSTWKRFWDMAKHLTLSTTCLTFLSRGDFSDSRNYMFYCFFSRFVILSFTLLSRTVVEMCRKKLELSTTHFFSGMFLKSLKCMFNYLFNRFGILSLTLPIPVSKIWEMTKYFWPKYLTFLEEINKIYKMHIKYVLSILIVSKFHASRKNYKMTYGKRIQNIRS